MQGYPFRWERYPFWAFPGDILPKVYSDYSGLSEAALATLGGKTVTDMTDNAHFPDPVPDLSDYDAAVTDYRTKHETATETGGIRQCKPIFRTFCPTRLLESR